MLADTAPEGISGGHIMFCIGYSVNLQVFIKHQLYTRYLQSIGMSLSCFIRVLSKYNQEEVGSLLWPVEGEERGVMTAHFVVTREREETYQRLLFFSEELQATHQLLM